VIAGHHGDGLRRAEAAQPGGDLGELVEQGDIGQVPGHHQMVRRQHPQILGEGGQDLGPVQGPAPAHPREIAEKPLVQQLCDPNRRQGPEMRVGDMGEREHPDPAARGTIACRQL